MKKSFKYGLRAVLLLMLCLIMAWTGGCSSSKDEGDDEAAEVDVDLTELSSTMVYAEVFNMMYEPEKYKGKSVRMEGNFADYYVENTDTHYFTCIIQDATACCSQGIEFLLKDADERTYPEDYPLDGDEITVVGVYDVVSDGQYEYYAMKDAFFEE